MLIRLLTLYLRPYARSITAVLALQLVQISATLYLPTLNADVINNGVLPGDTGHVLRTGGVMLVLTLVQMVCAGTAVYFSARTAMALGRDLRADVFSHVQTFSVREVGRFGAASLITRTTNDVSQIQTLVVMVFTLMVAAPIMGVGSVLLALRQDVSMSLLLLIVLPVLVTAVTLIVSRMGPLSASLQQRVDRINKVMREQLTGLRVVRAFVRDEHEQSRFAAANNDTLAVSLRLGRIQALMMPTVTIVMEFSSIAVLWFGGHRVDDGTLQPGTLIAFLQYLTQILQAVMLAMLAFILSPRARVCAGRIQEVLDTPSSVVPPAVAAPPGPSGGLEIRYVAFRYPGAQEPVLHDVSLTARPGRTTAIVGSTGSGKTTLLQLVPRLFDADEGCVRVAGTDVRDMDRRTLAATVGLVTQRPYLFSGTIASNLRYGNPEASDEELWRALEVAQARDFVTSLPEGLQAPVAQGGSNVSGGQRQRLAIARVLVTRPAICLFDDSYSALDAATEARLRRALAEERADTTIVVVAQRVSSVRDADRIVVLDEGRVVGSGTHDELMDDSETYREIVLSQLTEEEAAA
ncbi:ABC transporter ATP-binding protein/permease [Streptomyces filamentosus]|uniref:ABC transporter ATP-binding protein/permease n=1 Tax=Streptomyces filamentosus TaxID=67294 RepID=A0ABY4UNB0_STRFL|nr:MULTISPECIES: ABC transporter ATP-binding protein [Streptomyces]ESU50755.1 ABC transporter related protein [Streptomyces sp. HCCB10043]EWS95936.1 lipid A export permease/ATP-binding protein MsbA [Streptomyces filamentosus NRRL 11379]MYR82914.1 ATP-binding cassette domain-containing protein [Streptomyces sp. SID5466]USC45653.1 ABC transporter ATP-binding protein/permease [Streptomyces filamentosus]